MAYIPENYVQTGHDITIIDEIDSVLLDGGHAPISISIPSENNPSFFDQAYKMAQKMAIAHVEIDESQEDILLTDDGISLIEQTLGINNLFDPKMSDTLFYIQQALRARFVMHKDTHYAVQDGKIVSIDQNTGRLAPEKKFSDGLQQCLEVKENLEVSQESRPVSGCTCQNYFRMYNMMAGTTGTAKSCEDEFNNLFGLHVTQIPPITPCIREDRPDRVFVTKREKLNAAVDEITKAHEAGRPVLAGTSSVKSSKELSDVLSRQNIPHEILNAVNHERESEIIARAGKSGVVTVATNLAGRGVETALRWIYMKMVHAEKFDNHWHVHSNSLRDYFDDENLLSVDRISEMYGVHRVSIRSMVHQGFLTPHKIANVQ